ncbi:MAG: hypothetical protein JO273_21100 [Methylobacteriaceae bacterium]|nr:hypothetical protein [Methylobacteriaceae bacterium]
MHAVDLGGKTSHQRVEGGVELLHALVFELTGHPVEIDAEPGEFGHDAARLFDPIVQRRLDDAVIEERSDGLGRHRIDGERSDQRLDIHEVGIFRVLRAGACPQHPLWPGTSRGKPLPAIACDALFEALVGELGIGDRRLAEKLLRRLPVAPARAGHDAML